ncbi:MAG: glycosyltransferase family 2 protein [Salibacteraceae bacterium]
MIYSIIIPVYRSEKIIGKTVEKTLEVMRKHELSAEVVLVNDGSPDHSWEVISELAKVHKEVKAINFLRNYGQHTAVYCGIAESKGDFIITMDDDMQNPPEEIIKLIDKINEGYDLVFAEFKQKMHGGLRKMGTRVIWYLNAEIFGKPKDLKLTNFRIFTRETANRMLQYRTNYPYIPGLLLMHASKMANVVTDHRAREIGDSNYTLWRIAKLVSRLLFNYSSYPLKVMSVLGIAMSGISFLVGLFVIIKALFIGSDVQGWSTIVVLLSFLSGFILVMLGIMGEYIARMMNQMATNVPYQIRERIE